jgi:hypothetical protein
LRIVLMLRHACTFGSTFRQAPHIADLAARLEAMEDGGAR